MTQTIDSKKLLADLKEAMEGSEYETDEAGRKLDQQIGDLTIENCKPFTI